MNRLRGVEFVLGGCIIGLIAGYLLFGLPNATKRSSYLGQIAPSGAKSPNKTLPQSNAEATKARQLAHALESSRHGTYMLNSEIPELNERLSALTRKSVDFVMANRDPIYADLFAQLGLDDQVSAQLRQHIEKMYKAKIDANHALQSVMFAQVDFDKKIRELLGPKYEQYAAFEAADPARREATAFMAFASTNGFPALTPEEKTVIERTVEKHKAYSSRTLSDWGGPFDAIPQPVGGKWVPAHFERELASIKQTSAALMHEIRAEIKTSSTVNALEQYYGAEIAKAQDMVAKTRDPSLQQIEMLTKTVERLKANKASPGQIARMEKLLAEVRSTQKRSGNN